MGAGNTEQHFIQDAGELYVVYKIQHYLEWMGQNLNFLSGNKWDEFLNYCNDPKRNILSKFRSSDYCKLIDNNIEKFVNKLIKKYNQKMDVKNVEVEYRNKGKKGDFIIIFKDNNHISVSLKVYKKGFDNIQMCSGTWSSFVNQFFFEKIGKPGMYKTIDGNEFKGSDFKERNKQYEKINKKNIINLLENIDSINENIKNKYIYGDFAEFYTKEVDTSWKTDCKNNGTLACNLVKNILNELPLNTIKNKILTMGDLHCNEELFLIGPSGFVCSLFDEKYKNFLKRICSEVSKLEINTNKQSLEFKFSDSIGDIVKISVPFTFNKNGAWLMTGSSKPELHKKENKFLSKTQRRPKKSKELATSTNMWLCIKNNYTLF